MSRTYSADYILFLKKLDDENTHTLGTALGKACVEAKLPAAYVAQMLGVSRMALHSWFRGRTKVQERFTGRIRDMLELIKTDTEAGMLPVQSNKAAKAYIAGMTGVSEGTVK